MMFEADLETSTLSSPQVHELPSAYAARLAIEYAAAASEAHKKEYGQFFTPAEERT